MRAYVPAYQLISPESLGEALDFLAQDRGTWKPFAGGTDLMVLLEAGKLPHKNYVNIWNLKELRGIEVTQSHVTLGALTTIAVEHPEQLDAALTEMSRTALPDVTERGGALELLAIIH